MNVSAQRIYRGRRELGGRAVVTVHTYDIVEPLNPRHDLRNHSPSGFEWGYGGSGPAQLALAILADCLGDDEAAQRLYQDFKWEVVAKLPQAADWVLTEAGIRATVKSMTEEGRAAYA